jgi:hypothetical protein
VFRDVLTVSATCAVVVLPFMWLIGGISLKASYKHLIDKEGWQMPAAQKTAVVDAPLPLAEWNIGPNITPRDRIGWAAGTLFVMLNKAFFHVLTLPALVGVWLYRRRAFDVPGIWILFVSGMVLAPLLWRLGQSAGYIGERHVMLVLLGGLFFAVAALGALGHWLTRGRHAWVSLMLLVGIAGICLPKTLARLHGNRQGFREAGEWLAANTLPGDDVFDPLAWAGYHAGKLFVPRDAPRSTPAVCYVVLERSKNKHPHLWFLLALAEKLAARGEVVYRQRTARGREEAEIVIYQLPRPKDTEAVGKELKDWLAVNMRR